MICKEAGGMVPMARFVSEQCCVRFGVAPPYHREKISIFLPDAIGLRARRI